MTKFKAGVSIEGINRDNQKLSPDETLIAFLWRHIPKKPAKFSFKVFLVCELETRYDLNHKFYNRENPEEY